MRSILVLAFTELHCDPRVLRQIEALKGHYRVTACGLTDPCIDGISVLLVPGAPARPLRIRSSFRSMVRFVAGQYDAFYWSNPRMAQLANTLALHNFDLIIANDEATLPLALAVARLTGSKVLFDAHEYAASGYARLGLARLAARYVQYIYRHYAPRADGMMTVSDGIAREYAHSFGLTPVVVNNACSFEHLTPAPVTPERIRLIHHGICARDRHLHTMLELINMLDDRFTLDLMLVPTDGPYYRKLVGMARNNSRVRFLEPVPTRQIARSIHPYDIGVFLLPSKTINQEFVLPNKLFEFIQARLAVAIWPSPDMARIVEQYGCGIVSREFNVRSLTERLNALSAEELSRMKVAADVAAHELCAERNVGILNGLVRELVHPRGATHLRPNLPGNTASSVGPQNGSEIACVE